MKKKKPSSRDFTSLRGLACKRGQQQSRADTSQLNFVWSKVIKCGQMIQTTGWDERIKSCREGWKRVTLPFPFQHSLSINSSWLTQGWIKTLGKWEVHKAGFSKDCPFHFLFFSGCHYSYNLRGPERQTFTFSCTYFHVAGSVETESYSCVFFHQTLIG